MCPELVLLIGGWSHHFVQGDFNQTHDLVGVQCGPVVAATYTNSYYDRSNLLGYVVYEDTFFGVEAGLLAGYVSGYNEEEMASKGVFVSPYAKIEFSDTVGARIFLVPDVIALSFTFRF